MSVCWMPPESREKRFVMKDSRERTEGTGHLRP